jgi:hypothetical protein
MIVQGARSGESPLQIITWGDANDRGRGVTCQEDGARQGLQSQATRPKWRLLQGHGILGQILLVKTHFIYMMMALASMETS